MEAAAAPRFEPGPMANSSYRQVRWEKLKKVSFMAAPMVAVSLSQYFILVVTLMIVGHRGEVALSGVALASSVTNVSGFALLLGLSGALETLCGQAYGAGQYKKLGSYTFISIISLLTLCIPISILWVFMEKLLILAHQSPEISAVAGRYAIWLIPALFNYAILQSLVRYFQSQRLIAPMFVTSLISLCVHVPLCWGLVYKLGIGVKGAAISIDLSYWVNTILLLLVMRCSKSCAQTRTIVLKDALASTKEFFRYAIPSAMMICLEWMAFEILVLLSGLLPNSKLETSVISICLTTSSSHFNVVTAIGAAASTHVSNELGAGNPQAARAAAIGATAVAGAEANVVSIALFLCRHSWGYAYSRDKEVLDYAARITPILCLSMFLDSFLAVLCGVVRGMGWQRFGAFVNIGSYYLVGIPIGVVLCFALHLRGKGLWIGILTGCALQTTLLMVGVVGLANWQKESNKARERIFKETTPPGDLGDGV